MSLRAGVAARRATAQLSWANLSGPGPGCGLPTTADRVDKEGLTLALFKFIYAISLKFYLPALSK